MYHRYMNPKFWGPHGWYFLHSVTMHYPKNPSEQEKQIYFNFFKSLENVLKILDSCRAANVKSQLKSV